MTVIDRMETTSIMVQSEHIKIQSWPHARPDCPSAWNGSSTPCSQCYCFVCDIPVAKCDDIMQHAKADGRTPEWAQTKRRRRALAQTWTDIPNLVDLLVSFSVDESQLNGKPSTTDFCAMQSPRSISIEEKPFATAEVVKVLDFGAERVARDKYNDSYDKVTASFADEPLLHSLSNVKIEPDESDEADVIE